MRGSKYYQADIELAPWWILVSNRSAFTAWNVWEEYSAFREGEDSFRVEAVDLRGTYLSRQPVHNYSDSEFDGPWTAAEEPLLPDKTWKFLTPKQVLNGHAEFRIETKRNTVWQANDQVEYPASCFADLGQQQKRLYLQKGLRSMVRH
jgi:hypothetical protein